jgi:hypothetical protein
MLFSRHNVSMGAVTTFYATPVYVEEIQKKTTRDEKKKDVAGKFTQARVGVMCDAFCIILCCTFQLHSIFFVFVCVYSSSIRRSQSINCL